MSWPVAPHRAVEVIPGDVDAPVVMSCEHASNALPAPWSWAPEDARLVGMHWAVDLGIADLTRALSVRLGLPAVLARFSRLLIDANRPLDSDTLIRTHADGLPIGLNQHVSPADRAARIDGWYQPYHDALGATVAAHPRAALLAMHSFTPSYEGQPRSVEIGVLFDDDEALAHAVHAALQGHGYDVRLEEPWAGRGGFMFAPQSHARRCGRHAVELEIRQDLLLDAAHHLRLVELVTAAVHVIAGWGSHE